MPIGTGRGCVEPSALLTEPSALLHVLFLTVSNVPPLTYLYLRELSIQPPRFLVGINQVCGGKKEAAQAFLQGHVPVAQAASL